MHRLAALLLCSLLVAVAAKAAPAPVFRPSNTWVNGWDEPADPVGGCRFDRRTEKLTITVPAHGGRSLEHPERTAPHLLRDEGGYFDARVRVTVRLAGAAGDPFRTAGLLLKSGETTCLIQWRGGPEDSSEDGKAMRRIDSLLVRPYGLDGFTGGYYRRVRYGIDCGDRSAYLRLERRGGRLATSVSVDGAEWRQVMEEWGDNLPRKVKVGVIAQANAKNAFEAVFDEFKLTPLK